MRPVNTVPIVLDRPRTLLLNLKALALAEQGLAKFWGEKRISLIKVFNQGDLGIAELNHLLWAGLLHEEPTLTYDGAMRLLQGVDLTVLSAAITAAVQEQIVGDAPSAEGAAAAGDPPQPGPLTGTGSPSGPQPDTTSA